MAPTLYMIDPSPPVRAVLLCAKALGVELNLKRVDVFAKENLTPEYLQMNPNHTVPVLVEPNGFTVWDSHAINAYLVGKYGKGSSLYPEDPKKRTVVNQRLHFDTGTLFGRGLPIIRSILFFGAKKVQPNDAASLEEAYGIIETFLQNSPYVAGNELTIADFSMVISALALNILVPISQEKYPKFTSWIENMKELPYFADANEHGQRILKEALTNLLTS